MNTRIFGPTPRNRCGRYQPIYFRRLLLAVTDDEGNVLETYTHGTDLSRHVGGGTGWRRSALTLRLQKNGQFYDLL